MSDAWSDLSTLGDLGTSAPVPEPPKLIPGGGIEPPVMSEMSDARQAGHEWDAIDQYMDERRQASKLGGYSDAEVDQYLGYKLPDPGTLQTTTRLDAAMADEGTHPIEAASGGALKPSNDPAAPVTVNPLTADQRSAYADALTGGTVKGPDDFAQSFTDAVSATSGHDTSSATPEVAAQLPDPRDLIDHSIGVASAAGLSDSATLSGVRANMLEAWVQTGVEPKDIYSLVMNKPSAMAALLNPPAPPSTAFPPADGVPIKNPDFSPTMDFTGAFNKSVQIFGDNVLQAAHDILYLPGIEYDNTQKVIAMRDAPPNEDGTPKFTEGDVWGQIAQSPSLQLIASLLVGKAVAGAVGAMQSSEVSTTLRKLMTDTSGELAPERADELGKITTGALLRSVVRRSTLKESLDDIIEETNQSSVLNRAIQATEEKVGPKSVLQAAIQVSDQRAAMAAQIRDAVGESTYSKATAKATLEGYFSVVNKQVAGYQDWIKEFQGKTQEVANQTDAGETPSTADLTQDYHPLQTLYDHMENRPGGGRLDPSDAMYPMAETIRTLMQDRRDMLTEHVSDTMGFMEDYFPHSWLNPTKAVQRQFEDIYPTGKQGSIEHTKQRTIPYIFDGIVRGLTPKFPNPIEGALHYIQGVDDYVASEKVRTWLTGMGHAYYATQPKGALDMPLKGRSATIRARTHTDEKGTQVDIPERRLYAPRGYTVVYNNWVGKGFEQWPGWGVLYRKVLMAKNATLGLALGLSGFHPVAISMQVMASQFGRAWGNVTRGELLRALGNVGLAGLLPVNLPIKYVKGRRLQNVYMGTAANATDVEKQLAKIYKKAGGMAPSEGRGEPYFASQAGNLFKNWSRAGSWGLGPVGRKVAAGTGAAIGAAAGAALLGPIGVVPGAVVGRMLPVVPTLIRSTWNDTVAAIKGKPGEGALRHAVLPFGRVPEAIAGNFGRVSDTLMSPLFDDIIPKIKMAVWADQMEDFIRRNSEAEEAQIVRAGRQTMDSMDDRFGEMNLRNIFWSPYVKQLLNCCLVSLGWEYGTWRAIGRGLEDLILKPEGARFTTRTNVLLGSLLAAMFASGVYTYLATGTLPSVGHAALGIAETERGPVQIPFETKEAIRIYTLAVRAGSDPVKWVQSGVNYAWGKAQPMLKDVKIILDERGTTTLLDHLWANHGPVGISNMNRGVPPLESFMGMQSPPPELGGKATAKVTASKFKSPIQFGKNPLK